MKLKIDENADALYLRIDKSEIFESDEVSPGDVIDYNKEGHIVGIEVLRLSNRTNKINFKNLEFEIADSTI